jgi:hypothetical protein
MMPYPFDCPACTQRYWQEDSIVYDDEYDDHICYQCSDELQAERKEIANAEKGDL